MFDSFSNFFYLLNNFFINVLVCHFSFQLIALGLGVDVRQYWLNGLLVLVCNEDGKVTVRICEKPLLRPDKNVFKLTVF